jgi:initiation factor 1A
MPNVKGGKNYKKSKNTPDGPIFTEAAEDQLYGRIVRNLGNSNMLVYCNDNKRRICHIRGGIRKKMWLNVGDIILVSVREFVAVGPGEFERGDILTKYDPCWFGRLKKTEGFNMRLFMDLEKLSDTSEAWNSSAVILPDDSDNDDVFERGSDSDDEVAGAGRAGADADIDIDAI